MEKHPTERCRNGFYGAPQEQGFRRQIRHVEFGKRMEISGRKLWFFSLHTEQQPDGDGYLWNFASKYWHLLLQYLPGTVLGRLDRSI